MRRTALHLALVAFGVALVATTPAAGTAYDDANISVYHADESLDSADEVEAAVQNGTASGSGYVLLNDSLVVAIDSGRLAADIDARDGTPTERFFAVLDGDPQLLVHQLNYRHEREPNVFLLGPANTTAYRAGNTTYAVIDTGAVDTDIPGATGEVPDSLYRIETGDVYGVEIAASLSAASDSDPPSFEFVGRPSGFSEPPDRFGASPADVVPAERVNLTVLTLFEPDSGQEVRMVLENGREITAPLDEPSSDPESTQQVRLDLRGVPDGTDYTVQLVYDGTVVHSRNGTVRRPNATLSNPRVVEVGGDRYLNVTARLPWGGEVIVTTADGERRTAIEVVAGQRVDLSIPARDRDGRVQVPENGQVRAVRPNGRPYLDATYEIGDEGLPAVAPTRTATETATATPTSTPTGRDDPEALPGFGVPSAVLALLALVAVGYRRRTV